MFIRRAEKVNHIYNNAFQLFNCCYRVTQAVGNALRSGAYDRFKGAIDVLGEYEMKFPFQTVALNMALAEAEDNMSLNQPSARVITRVFDVDFDTDSD